MRKEYRKPGRNRLSAQLRILSALNPGVGAFDKEKIQKQIRPDLWEKALAPDVRAIEKERIQKEIRPDLWEKALAPEKKHGHREMSPKELRKLALTMALKAVLGISGMMLGLGVSFIPGWGWAGLILSPVLGIFLYNLVKAPGGHH